MITLREIVGVATSGLQSRPLRFGLMAAGPLLGVAVIVGALGILQSTEGELRERLSQLGSNLAVVTPGLDQVLPEDSAARVSALGSVEGVAGISPVGSVIASTTDPGLGLGGELAFSVFAAGPDLLDVLSIELAWGRPLGGIDEAAHLPSALLGSAVADRFALSEASTGTVFLDGRPFGVVGVMEPSLLAPELDQTLLIPRSKGQRMATAEGDGFSALYVRVAPNRLHPTAELLPIAATMGDPALRANVALPAQLLQAQAAIDSTLATAVVALGVLAMAIGSFGIANVMVISVLERRREIGVRRALGHPRIAIFSQFLLEGFIVGTVGALTGAALAVGFVYWFAAQRGWVVDLPSAVVAVAVGVAVVLSALAALHPAARAARLEPLEALRAT